MSPPSGPRPRGRVLLLGAVLVAALAVFAWHGWSLRFVDPPPWPDEAMFADVSAHLARTGVLATDLFRESVPSTARHFYLYPPLYLLLVAGVFAGFGPGLLAMRMTSLVTAAAALGLVFGISRRAGLGRPTSFGAVSLAAVDLVLMRAAHNGRMELLTLLFVLAVVWLGLGPSPGEPGGRDELPGEPPTVTIHPRGWRVFGMGAAAGLSFLSHPLGMVALPVALALLVAGLPDPRGAGPGWAGPALRGLAALLAGLAAALLPWGIYILRDPSAFVHQFGVQFSRKLAETHAGGCLAMTASQWPLPVPLTLVVLAAGVAGLAIAGWWRAPSARRPAERAGAAPGPATSPAARGLFACQLLIGAAVLSGCEQWYAVYLVPLGAIGLARLVALTDETGARGLAGTASLVLATIWAFASIAGMAFLSTGAGPRGGEDAYRDWSRRIEQALPRGSTVVLDVVPTPSFGFRGDRGLELRLFRLAGFQLDPAREGRAMEAFDYAVLGGRGSRALADSVRSRGTAVAEIRNPQGFTARIYRMRKGAAHGGDRLR